MPYTITSSRDLQPMTPNMAAIERLRDDVIDRLGQCFNEMERTEVLEQAVGNIAAIGCTLMFSLLDSLFEQPDVYLRAEQQLRVAVKQVLNEVTM